MAISITSTPTKTKGSYDSFWVAASNPVVFTLSTSGSPLDNAVQVALYEEDGTTQIVELTVIPFPSSNQVVIDISAFLQSELNNNDDSLTAQQTIDAPKENNFKVFRLGYRPNAVGAYTVDSTEYIAVNNVKQANEQFGANLADYVPDFDAISSPTSVTAAGKFLSTLQNPVLFWVSPENNSSPPGNEVTIFYPSLAFILPEEYATTQANYKVRTETNTGAVTRVLTLASPNEKGIRYVNWATSIPVSDDTYTKTIVTTEILTTDDDCLIEPITFEIRRACINPVAIKWKDKLGSWQVWIFEGDAPFGRVVESDETVEIPYTELSTLKRLNKTLSKTEIPTLGISAEFLTKEQVIALQGIRTSPNVLICTSPFNETAGEDADDWVSVNVIDSDGTLFNERLATYSISFEMELIELFNINN